MTERESPYLWSTTAANNGAIDGNINFAEGQLPGTLNNSNRGVMAAHARFLKDTNGSITSGGSANAYTLTVNGTQTAYATGQLYSFKANFSNTGASTLNVTNADATALGAKSIRVFFASGESTTAANMIRSGGHYVFQYDAAANSAAGGFILLNPTIDYVQTGTDVTSIAGNTGAFTLSRGITNSTNDIRLASYNIQVYRSTSQSFTSATKTKIQFDTEVFDSPGWFDNATNYRYTPLVAGKYLVTVVSSFSGTSATGVALAMIYKNGTEYAESLNMAATTGGQGICTAIVDMNGSTDYIEGWGRGTATTPSFDGGTAPMFTWMNISYVGP